MRWNFNKILLAGVSSIYGIKEIKKKLSEDGYFVRFVDTQNMLNNYFNEDSDIEVAEEIGIDKSTLYLPLNEFWLSYGHKKKIDQISDRAYKASRSKKYMSWLLCKNGMEYVNTLSIKEARKKLCNGEKILIKPDTYYSGHGVKVIDKRNMHNLCLYIQQATQITEEAKRVLMIDKENVEIWEYVEGDEYSADIFVHEGSYEILRLCKKKIVLIDDSPCVVAYITTATSSKIKNTIFNWMDIICGNNDITFCQIDFIKRHKTGNLVLIDFSCRVGGGMVDMIKRYKNNIYMDALRTLVNQQYINNISNNGIYQLNIVPIKKGMLKSDNYDITAGEIIKYKNKGEYITRIGGSANDRLGCIVGDDFLHDFCSKFSEVLIGDQYID